MKTIFFICATLLSMTLSAQLQKTFVDPRDGQKYPICKIDRQVFMSRNLATKVFRNGDSLLQITTNKDWFEAQKNHLPAWRYFNDDSTTIEKYGLLYNWFAVTDPRGLAPEGWHIPSKLEFEELIQTVGPNADELKSKTDWEENLNGTNLYGFNAYPCGLVKDTGKPVGQEWSAQFWTTSVKKKYYPYSFLLLVKEEKLNISFYLEGSGLSIRCIRDN
jgi:uncharacterized protein (TIGR02145 family)